MLWSVSRNIAVTALILVTLLVGMVSAGDDREGRRIDYLISSVERLAGTKFVRNGSEYDGRQAADHLRMKRKRAGGRVQTAEDFIRLCASKSYLSGKPYTIRFADGKTIESEKYFRAQLKKFDASAK
jgi:hypothetical protein